MPSSSSCSCFSLTQTSSSYDYLAASMGECLWTARERASFYVGLLSVVCWLICQLPQILENYKRGDASGLSKWLLAQWVMGDTLNLIGTFLTRQLLFQRIASVMFVIMDCIMISQRIYYTWKNANNNSTTTRITVYSSTNLPLLAAATTTMLFTSAAEATTTSHDVVNVDESMYSLISLCEIDYHVSHGAHFIGLMCGWMATMMYVGSRIPQIIQIRRRQSVDGISKTMFIAAVFGNLTYGSALLLRDSSGEGIAKALPWVVGSWGVLFLDCFILSHFAMYDEKKGQDVS